MQAVHDGTFGSLQSIDHQHQPCVTFLTANDTTVHAGVTSDLLDDLVQDDRAAARDYHSGVWEQDWSEVVNKQATQRKKGERWGGEDTLSRPHPRCP